MTALNEFNVEVWEQPSIHKIISRAMARPDATTFKFDGEMLLSSKPLFDWAEYVVDHYQGTFELMVSFKTQARLGKQLSPKQLAVALNTLLRCWKRSLEQVKVTQPKQAEFDMPVDFKAIPSSFMQGQLNPELDAQAAAVTTTVPSVQVQRPSIGTYTYVAGDGEYRVIRFATPKLKDGTIGQTMYVAYQYGADNENDFARCGRIDKDGKLVLWAKAYLSGQREVKLDGAQRASLVEAISFICMLDKDAQLKSGEAYALRSGRCFICGRTLTVPSSISAGIGPVCADKWGV